MTTTDLVAYSDTVSLPITVEEAVKQWDEYQRLTQSLLNATDFQKIGSRSFKKKSAWRKYARAFNISDRVTHEEIARAEDGFPLFARIRVEASHPNGRTAEADHECHVKERCCPASTGANCDKKTWRGHYCCTTGCNGRLHWSHPGDLPATALTRAKNRAISDLIGAGEVSAEEMEGQRHADEDDAPPAPRQAPQRAPQRPQQAPTPRSAAVDAVIEGEVREVTAPAKTDLTRETQALIVDAYHAVQKARGEEFRSMVLPELMKKWPHAFQAHANNITALAEAEGQSVIEWLGDETPFEG
jgi:hypothetical protein